VPDKLFPAVADTTNVVTDLLLEGLFLKGLVLVEGLFLKGLVRLLGLPTEHLDEDFGRGT
jgi:hypothetical protein